MVRIGVGMNQLLKKQEISAYEKAYTASDFEVIQAKYRKQLLIELLNKNQPKHVLEVGCGMDTIANVWNEFDTLTIVEPGPQFAHQARLDTKRKSNIQIFEGFIEDVSGSLKAQYDLILLSSLLHEVPDPSGILQSVKALCTEHTLVHINVPNAKSMHRLLALEMGLIDSVEEPSALQKTFKQPRIFDLDSLKSLAESVGFHVVSHGSFFMKPFTHAQMTTLTNSNFMNEDMLDGLWGLIKHFPENGSEIYINIQRKG
jgi:ubiquinone/menaquinone biosynthesis C-methylase UbiE